MSIPRLPDPLPRRTGAWLPRAQVGRAALKLLFELVVVFAGVYAAFAVESRERQREAEVRRAQFQAALVREIESITSTTRNAAIGTGRIVESFETAWAAGRRPPLSPIMEPIRVQTHMWEALLQSGGLELFDVTTVFQLSQFYNALNAGFEQLAQLRQLSETMLLPRLGEPEATFYDPKTRRPRDQYRWYIEGIKRLHEEADRITVIGDRLVTALKQSEGAAPAGP